MSKAKLEFDLNDFDDRLEFERATKSTEMALVLWQMSNNVRKSLYYKFEDLSGKGEKHSVYDGIDAVLEVLFQELNEHGINIDKLVV